MKRSLALTVCILFAITAVPSAFAGMDDKEPFKVTSTGFGAKGAFKAFAEAFHGIYRHAYPGTAATAKPSSVAGGMVDVANGKSDVHYSITTIDYEYGLNGAAPFESKVPDGALLHMFTLMDNLDMYFVARKAWAEQNGIKTLADIARVKPKMNLGMNRKGVLITNVTIEDIFKEYGFTPDDVLKWGGNIAYNGSSASIQDLRDGKTDLMIEFGIHPDARIADVSKTRDLVWLSPDRGVLDKVAAKRDMQIQAIPGKYYGFLGGDVTTLRTGATVAAGKHVSDEAVYKMVKAVAENLDRVHAIHPSFQQYSKDTMLAKPKAMAYHPGAEKYYRERGWLK
ncbi:MAG: TAXI family TRAP transporter solute-binding subunit [Proteobacteria bacterium]|nr:TAXI family TRAP transporter solute-binding subunit [Pseudomonadota bacterium]